MGERWYLRTMSDLGPMWYVGYDWTPSREDALDYEERDEALCVRDALCDEMGIPRSAVRVVRVGPPRRYTLTEKGRAATEPARQGVDGTPNGSKAVPSQAARPEGSGRPDPGGFQVGDRWADPFGFVYRVTDEGFTGLRLRYGSGDMFVQWSKNEPPPGHLRLVERAGKPWPHTEVPKRYALAFTRDGRPDGDVVDWAHDLTGERVLTFASADEARAENDRGGWTHYVREYPSGARVAS